MFRRNTHTDCGIILSTTFVITWAFQLRAMIYFQISVRPLGESYDSESLGRYRVDALFTHEDPRECLSHLLTLLRADAWEIVEITEARTIFAQAELSAARGLAALFRQAEKQGVAYRLNWADCTVAV